MLSSVYAPKDFKRLRVVGDLVARCFDYISPYIVAGISTGEIDSLVAGFLKENGARSSDLGYMGYPKSICTSINEVVCHGIPNDNVILKDGDIINIDLTAEFHGFHGDASRMFMIGNVSNKARELVQTAQDALNAAISICAPGVPLSEIGKTIEAVVKPHGFSIVEDFCGHGIGKVMHDNPNILHFYDKAYDKLIMQPGFVFTIEPMINVGTHKCEIDSKDGWTVRTADGGLSAQWEHTLGITEDGVIIFTEKMSND